MSRPPIRPSGGPVLSVFALGILCGVLSLSLIQRIVELTSDSDERLLLRVRELVETTFVDELPRRELVDRALDGLVDGLDDYSEYFTGPEIKRLDRETTGLYRGIGVLFRTPPEDGQILFALPHSPADKVGLRPGDRFLSLEGDPVADMAPGELQERLRNPATELLRLEVAGLDTSRREVDLRPEPVVDPSVRHGRMLEESRGVGYLAIASFSRKTPEEFQAEVEYLQRAGMRSLVIDLRANPGGVLDAAVEIANAFVSDGTLVTTRSRTEERVYEAEAGRAYLVGTPLAVLVDGESASASEVLAGALQDHRAATVVGAPTYGKGVVQTLTRFPEDRALLKLTTSRYYTPAGRPIGRGGNGAQRGLVPDLLVEAPPAVQERVRAFLRSYSPPHGAETELQAWEALEGRPLLDPHPPDPQLEAAAGLLSGELPGTLASAQ